MKEERKNYYKSKITTDSMTGIICTMYEMFLEYLQESFDGESPDKDSLRNASKVLEHFKNALDFNYEISGNLYALYDFCERQLSKAMYLNSTEPLDSVKKIMSELGEAFAEVDKQDNSGSAMKNSQTITAGLTYGRNELNETMDNNSNRGFLA